MDCPYCGNNDKFQKKGKNSKGDQRYRCGSCGKQFIDAVKNDEVNSQATVTTSKEKPRTIIKVNSTEVTKIDGHITEDLAFTIISQHFREVSKSKCNTEVLPSGDKMIQFTINTGTKG